MRNRQAKARHRLALGEIVSPRLHDHLVGARHDQRPVLPVLNVRNGRGVVGHGMASYSSLRPNAMQSIGLSEMDPPRLLPDALVMLDYVGIAVFAVSGALAAAERKLDFVTFIFFAVVTG